MGRYTLMPGYSHGTDGTTAIFKPQFHVKFNNQPILSIDADLLPADSDEIKDAIAHAVSWLHCRTVTEAQESLRKQFRNLIGAAGLGEVSLLYPLER